jgi:hypothetical protein
MKILNIKIKTHIDGLGAKRPKGEALSKEKGTWPGNIRPGSNGRPGSDADKLIYVSTGGGSEL